MPRLFVHAHFPWKLAWMPTRFSQTLSERSQQGGLAMRMEEIRESKEGYKN
jgi:hypothetical protein